MGGLGEPLSAWRAPCNADEDLTKQSAINPLIEKAIDDVEEVEKGRQDQNCDDAGLSIGQRSLDHARTVAEKLVIPKHDCTPPLMEVG